MNYKPKLDAIRGVAILLVMIEHFAHFPGKFIHGGYVGVDLFFTLSGFLITKILYESKGSISTAFKRFFMRRVLRIFPIYYGSILLLIFLNNPDVLRDLKYLLSYTYNYAIPALNIQYSIVYHFWSLSVEEQFYIVWPIVVLSLRYQRNLLILVIMVVVLLSYLQLQYNIFGIREYNYFGVFPRSYSLGIGGLGAVLYCNKVFNKEFFNSSLQEWIMIFAFLFALIRKDSYDVLLIVPIVSIYWVIKAYHDSFEIKRVNRFFGSLFLQKIGIISYGIYVFHIPIVHYTIQPLFDYVWLWIEFEHFGIFSKAEWHPWILQFPIYSATAYFFAFLSYNYFEKPILLLKDKYFS